MPDVMTENWTTQVMEEHRKLNNMVSAIRKFLDEPRPDLGVKGAHTWAADLSRMMVDLHDELFRHFRLEEESGMVEEISTHHPRAAQTIAHVVEEHPQILRDLRGLIDETLTYSEGKLPPDPAIRQQVTALLDQLHEHEREETDLIQRLEYRDFGEGD